MFEKGGFGDPNKSLAAEPCEREQAIERVVELIGIDRLAVREQRHADVAKLLDSRVYVVAWIGEDEE